MTNIYDNTRCEIESTINKNNNKVELDFNEIATILTTMQLQLNATYDVDIADNIINVMLSLKEKLNIPE